MKNMYSIDMRTYRKLSTLLFASCIWVVTFGQGQVQVSPGTITLDIMNDLAGSGSGQVIGVQTAITSGGLSSHYGIKQALSGTGSSSMYGIYQFLNVSGNGSQYGSFQAISNSGTGNHYGNYNQILGTGSGSQYGSYQFVSNNGSGDHYGSYNRLTGTGGGTQYGSFQDILTSGTEDKYASYNKIQSTATLGDEYGTFQEITSHGQYHYGTFNKITGNDLGSQFGTVNQLVQNGIGVQYGTTNNLSGNTSGDQLCVVNTLAGSGTGAQLGVETTFSGAGSGAHYGVVNKMLSTGNGTHYGVHNDLTGIGTGVHTGTRNTLSGTGAGTHYGTYNAITSTGTGLHAAGYFDATGGLNSYAAIFQRGKVVVNESGGDSDFRVESENNPYQIFVDASLDRVGINTSGPEATLDIVPDSGEDPLLVQSGLGDLFRVKSNGSVIFGEAPGPLDMMDVFIEKSLGLGVIPEYKIDIPNANSFLGKGRAYAWVTYSDRRVKTSVEDIQYGLQTILALRPVQYQHHASTFKDGALILGEATHDIGFIAQEMHQVISEIVEKPEDEARSLWSMNYEKLTPVLVKAIQELVDENASLKAQLDQFEERLARVERDGGR